MTAGIFFAFMRTHVSPGAAPAHTAALAGTPLTEKTISALVFFFLHRSGRAVVPVSIFGRKFVFSYAALRAYPVVGQIFKGSSGGNTVVGIADRRVVHITACIADILFHRSLLFRFNWLTGFRLYYLISVQNRCFGNFTVTLSLSKGRISEGMTLRQSQRDISYVQF
jgi:hypothetical protein